MSPFENKKKNSDQEIRHSHEAESADAKLSSKQVKKKQRDDNNNITESRGKISSIKKESAIINGSSATTTTINDKSLAAKKETTGEEKQQRGDIRRMVSNSPSSTNERGGEVIDLLAQSQPEVEEEDYSLEDYISDDEDDDTDGIIAATSTERQQQKGDSAIAEPRGFFGARRTRLAQHRAKSYRSAFAVDKLAAVETMFVRMTRYLVVAVLLLSAILMGVLTFFFVSDNEQDDFHAQFRSDAQEILAVSTKNAATIYRSIRSFSVIYPSFADQVEELTLPYLTLYDFEAYAASTRQVSGATLIAYTPFVPNSRARFEWEEYSRQHAAEWIQRGYELNENLAHQLQNQQDKQQQVNVEIRDYIWNYDPKGEVLPSLAAPFSPLWQMSPPPIDTTIVNFDLYSEPVFASLLHITEKLRQSTLSPPINVQELFGTAAAVAESEQQDPTSAATTTGTTTTISPRSIFLQPVFFDFIGPGSSQLAGNIAAVIPWENYFVDLLHDSSYGVVVVVESCGTNSTFLVRGPFVEFVGEGDLHDTSYGHLSLSGPFAELEELQEEWFQQATGTQDELTSSAGTSQGSMGVEQNDDYDSIDDDICRHMLHIFPTSEMEEKFETSDPVVFTVVIVSIFSFAILVFVVYNWFVERRQTKVVRTANQTDAIVSELFPDHVRQQLMHHNDNSRRGSGGSREFSSRGSGSNRTGTGVRDRSTRGGRDASHRGDPSTRDHSGRNGRDSTRNNDNSNKEDEHSHSYSASGQLNRVFRDAERNIYNLDDSKPIAELYPDVTVMFADIAGFTAWSSLREPSQVFILLESIFQTFDEIAKKRGVFKVETVGDCYVAVAGVPKPCPDHALVMARFARACLDAFIDTARGLELTLGPDTGDLAMRFGLHSGPVTAGVLRGDRARFQLFGDTMNTASRIESTGERNCIQLSEVTANLIREGGKQGWVVPRADQVRAKGKGLMRTFWLRDHSGKVAVLNQHQIDNHEKNKNNSSGSASTMKSNHAAATELEEDAKGATSTGEMSPKSKRCRMSKRNGYESSDDELDWKSLGSDGDGNAKNDQEDTEKSEVFQPPPVVQARRRSLSSMFSNLNTSSNQNNESLSPKRRNNQRLVDWNVELLLQLLRQVIARRQTSGGGRSVGGTLRRAQSQHILSAANGGGNSIPTAKLTEMAIEIGKGQNVVDEVAEVVHLPEFDVKAVRQRRINSGDVLISQEVAGQLHRYVTCIAAMYRDVPFHNFEHASHVTMSVSKLLSRIIAPVFDHTAAKNIAQQEAMMHDHTYGITSDPLTQFAVVLSALIHDVDHRGISNPALAKEDPSLAEFYKNKSIAEQNSVDLAWKILMQDEYEALRNCIFVDETELRRFRQLVVNSVIATDIFDKELSALRKNRWDKAFQKSNAEASREDIDRKATIVIEHLIQASDVSHTMQHWHVYRKWNERLFEEMYKAYLAGRTDQDPSENWYNGELGFFDNYVIPLAKKLKECGVFGVSSDEYLTYAQENRKEWADRGHEIVFEFMERFANNEQA